MKKIILFLGCCISGQVSIGQTLSDNRLRGLDTFVTKILSDWHAPGMSITVVEKNKIIFAGGYGFRDAEKKLPVTENTLFAIGSCTKAFTAVMIGELIREGRIALDKPVRTYLPELKFKDEYTNSHATIRDLLCHRTGLPRHDLSWYGATATRNELLERIQYLEPSAELREKFQYNNLMYMALGMVIEKVTGKTWEDNVRERILIPLGMNNSNLSVTDLEKSADRSLAYSLTNDTISEVIPYRNIDAVAPAGGINSSAKDMGNWLITWINTGRFNGKEIIPPGFRIQSIIIEMATGGGLPGRDNPDIHLAAGYGFAWGMSSYRGHYRVDHTGGIDGFNTLTTFFPSDSIGIFVSSSQGSIDNIIRNFIADRMLGLPYYNWNRQQLDLLARTKASPRGVNSDSLNRKTGTHPSHELTEYTGFFENKGYGRMKLFVEKDTIWVEYNESGRKTKSYLQHYHYDVFRLLSTDDANENFNAQKFRFNSGNKGQIISFETQMEPAVKDILFEKLAAGSKN